MFLKNYVTLQVLYLNMIDPLSHSSKHPDLSPNIATMPAFKTYLIVFDSD